MLYTIETCMHGWPVYDNYGIAATDVLWDYFEMHTKNINTSQNHAIPMDFKLYQNYPNPFNPVTTIRYRLTENGLIIVILYNPAGLKIAELINQYHLLGIYSVVWNGEHFSSGVYSRYMKAGSYSETIKLVLQK